MALRSFSLCLQSQHHPPLSTLRCKSCPLPGRRTAGEPIDTNSKVALSALSVLRSASLEPARQARRHSNQVLTLPATLQAGLTLGLLLKWAPFEAAWSMTAFWPACLTRRRGRLLGRSLDLVHQAGGEAPQTGESTATPKSHTKAGGLDHAW